MSMFHLDMKAFRVCFLGLDLTRSLLHEFSSVSLKLGCLFHMILETAGMNRDFAKVIFNENTRTSRRFVPPLVLFWFRQCTFLSEVTHHTNLLFEQEHQYVQLVKDVHDLNYQA